jgi:cyclohexanone monooxygenase
MPPNDVDVSGLSARYEVERRKRTRADADSQYLTPSGQLAGYAEDPWVAPDPARDPIIRDVDVALVGAGFGSIQAAAELVKSGVDDFLVLDRAGDFGGVWYWNRYPGIACDIDSYIYLPLLEETGYMPSEKYARGPEVFAYARRLATHFDLYRRALFQVEIVDVRWQQDRCRWLISTDHGDRISARFVNLATGPLQRPRLPALPGLASFAGRAFHSSRWDYAYTGGDSSGGLSGLTDKRVGIIGTGATGVQIVPHVGAHAQQLFVFQRTPAPVPVRNHQATDADWFANLAPGWQQERMDNFNILVTGGSQDVDMVADGWTAILHDIGMEIDSAPIEDAERRQVADFRFMDQLRSRIDELVDDPATAASLKPYYNAGCKRPCFHDEYLQTFNRANVTLVDTDGRGVTRITPGGVIVGDREYELDCLIFATGFEFNHLDLANRNGFEITGRDGLTLTAKWRAGGISTFHGFTIRDFPNLVIQANAQGGVTPNLTHGLGEGGKHFAYLVGHALKGDIATFEPSAEAEQAWVDRVHSMSYRTKFDLECTPGYYNNDGRPTEGAGIKAFYPGSPHRFMQMMQRWRGTGDLAGLELTPISTLATTP